MPEPTGLNLIDSLEFGLYEENLAEVRHYNEHITNTSLNEMPGVHLMNNIKTAITLGSDQVLKANHHPWFHVENHMEAKAFADEVVKNLDEKFHLFVDLGVYKSLQNFRLYMNHKVNSPRVKQHKSGTFRAFGDLIIAFITGPGS